MEEFKVHTKPLPILKPFVHVPSPSSNLNLTEHALMTRVFWVFLASGTDARCFGLGPRPSNPRPVRAALVRTRGSGVFQT